MMNMSDTIETARFNMIEQQIRPAEVLDPAVLQVIADIPREQFVPKQYAELAFSDTNIPLANGQVMMSPIQEARLVQALSISKNDNILEIGTGSGYVTALLAALGKQVRSVEIDSDLLENARKTLEKQKIANTTLENGDASQGWPSHAPYDVIAVTGSLPLPDEHFQQQLSVGGRLFVIIGTAPAMSAYLITRTGEDQWSRESLFETHIPPLINAQTPPEFVF